MADKIYIDTQLLEALSLEISQLKNSLTQVNSRVSSSLSEVRCVASSQTGTIGRMSKAQQNLGLTVRHADALAKAVGLAADLWEKAEKRIASQRLPESGEAPQGEGGGDTPGWTTGSIGGGFLYKLLTGKLDWDGALISSEESADGHYIKSSFFGGSFKTKGQGQSSWDFSKKKSPKPEIGIKESITQELYIAQLEGGYKGEYGEYSGKTTVGGGSVTGEVGLTLFSDGKFDPSIYGKVKGDAYVVRGEISGKVGTDDLNAYASAEGTLVGAEGEIKVGYDDGKFSAKAGGEAYLAKAEIKGGFEIFGIKIGATGEAMAGVNATAGAEVGPDSAQGEIGLGPFKIKINVDWSNFAKRYL